MREFLLRDRPLAQVVYRFGFGGWLIHFCLMILAGSALSIFAPALKTPAITLIAIAYAALLSFMLIWAGLRSGSSVQRLVALSLALTYVGVNFGPFAS